MAKKRGRISKPSVNGKTYESEYDSRVPPGFETIEEDHSESSVS